MELEKDIKPAKDKSTFSINVIFEDENFDEKTAVLKFRKRYDGRMKILNLATSKIQAGELLSATSVLAKNAFIGSEEDKKVLNNDDVITSLMKHSNLFLGTAIAELQLD